MRRVLSLVHRRQATLSYAAHAFLRTVSDGSEAGSSILLPRGTGRLKQSRFHSRGDFFLGQVYSLKIPFRIRCFAIGPSPAIYNAESGARHETGAPESTSSLPARRLRSREDQDRMKKIALIVFLLAVCVAAAALRKAGKTSASAELPLLSLYGLFH